MASVSHSNVSESVEGFALSPQQRMLWHWYDVCGAAAFTTRCAYRVDGELDAEALERAANELVRRHEILRTTFQRMPGMKVPGASTNGLPTVVGFMKS